VGSNRPTRRGRSLAAAKAKGARLGNPRLAEVRAKALDSQGRCRAALFLALALIAGAYSVALTKTEKEFISDDQERAHRHGLLAVSRALGLRGG
jgi:hypothetical protein